jgi:ATP-dependent protease Clp ATPase subunit
MKNMKELTMSVMKKEAGKKEVNIAQTKELLSIVSDMLVGKDAGKVLSILIKNGERRAKRKQK